jgi:hypothetical protein
MVMARNAGTETDKIASDKMNGRRSEAQQIQAAFDFLPQEMRHRMRFADVLRAGRADLRNQSRLIDRQVVGIGSRIAAARLREILRPAHELAAPALGMNMPESAAVETESLELGAVTTDTGLISQQAGSRSPATSNAAELAAQREILREIGTAVFYFRDEDETLPEGVQMQRLHPRPLPARYYGAPPQQAGAAAAPARVSGEWESPSARKIA